MTDPRILGNFAMQTRALERVAESLETIAEKESGLAVTAELATRLANGLLDLMEIEGSECAHGFGPAVDCPEPDCAWNGSVRKAMRDAAAFVGRDLGSGALDA